MASITIKSSTLLTICNIALQNVKLEQAQKVNEFYFLVRSIKTFWKKDAFPVSLYPTSELIDDYFDHFYPSNHVWGWKSSPLAHQCYYLYTHYVVPFRKNMHRLKIQQIHALCELSMLQYGSESSWINLDSDDMHHIVQELTPYQRKLLLDSDIAGLLSSNVVS